MLILVDSTPDHIVRHVGARAYNAHFGALITPRSRRDPDRFGGVLWGADNDCFSGFNPVGFQSMLDRWKGRPGCLFVAAPDVVENARQTLARFEEWRPILAGMGFPVALVAQDGLQPGAVPWEQVAALFIGGSTAWKLGPGAAAVAQEARRRGKWLHMGRVNSIRRLQYAHTIGCDSVDGSGFSTHKHKTKKAAVFCQNPQLPLPGCGLF